MTTIFEMNCLVARPIQLVNMKWAISLLLGQQHILYECKIGRINSYKVHFTASEICNAFVSL
jgi:hypothetical protein